MALKNKLNKRKCKVCDNTFQKTKPLQMVCDYTCSIEYGKKQQEKKVKTETKAKKESLKTLSDHLKELEVLVNRFIRLRDNDKPCISCLKPLKSKFDAGHYRSKGGNPQIRFNEDNIHAQCVYCNRHLHGNLIDYRINLIKRIGLEKVQILEGFHPPRKYTIPEAIILKSEYEEKIKNIIKNKE